MNTHLLMFLAGAWAGCGIAPSALIWAKNPAESFLWKLFHTLCLMVLGPLNFMEARYWLRLHNDLDVSKHTDDTKH